MNSEAGDSTSIPGGDQETGQPLRVLVEQERAPSPDFIGQVRSKIHRRITGSQFVYYSWNLPKLILREMISVFGHLLKAFGTNKEP